MANKKNLIIHVPNASVMCLFDMEMSGQISDGKYENSRPYDHWKWVCDIADIVIDNKVGISSTDGSCWRRFGYTTKKYNLNEWPTYINKWRKKNDNDYKWATRIIAYGKFGIIYPEITYKQVVELGECRIFLEYLQMMIEDGITDAEELYNDLTNFQKYEWRKKYFESCKDYITLDFVKKYLEIEYDLKEVKNDLKLLADSVNTMLQ